MKLEEIKETLRIHNELAPSQISYLIEKCERYEAALKEIKEVGLSSHGKGSEAMAFAAGNCAGLASKALEETK